MARYRESLCRICRRDGIKLFLKGERCYTERCSIERRNYPPGEHGDQRKKFSEYAVQLREKQKVKHIYGVLEKQFRIYYRNADSQKGITGENLLNLLERRLDNTVFRLGLANSRNEARQLVRHNHFLVNGRKVNIPSYSLKVGDVVEVKEKSRKIPPIVTALESVVRRGIPQWLELEKEQFRGVIKTMPTREDITLPINEHLVISLYSR